MPDSMHVMELPRKVIVGEGILSKIGDILGDLEIGKSVLAVSGPNVSKLLGEKVRSSLERSSFQVKWKIINESTFACVEDVTATAKSIKSSCLIGIGGGKSIDAAKLASFNNRVPFVSVPTSASHDGISSPFASVKGLDRPYSLVAKPPIAIVADTDVIASAPASLLRSGCGDLISKETAVKDWSLSHEKTGEYYGGYSANLALMSAELVIESSSAIRERTDDSVRVVVEALISSGVAAGIAGSSRPCSGSEHLFSHAMDIVAPGKGMHGEKCGMGTIMMAKLHGIDYEMIKESLIEIGCPTTASQINATQDEVVKSLILAGTIRKERFTILNEANLDESSALKLARDVGVL
jgi:glycerol-1-phosphate dehydrogenase [NAD(P)+]